jgi:two-component system cell cycle response regulator DivK
MTKKILIVEDNAMNRALLMAILKPEGYELLIAENGQVGVEIATRELPDLILMDVMLPIMNGYEATRKIKANPAKRDRALDAGCDGYITKPVDTRALPNQVKLFLR